MLSRHMTGQEAAAIEKADGQDFGFVTQDSAGRKTYHHERDHGGKFPENYETQQSASSGTYFRAVQGAQLQRVLGEDWHGVITQPQDSFVLKGHYPNDIPPKGADDVIYLDRDAVGWRRNALIFEEQERVRKEAAHTAEQRQADSLHASAASVLALSGEPQDGKVTLHFDARINGSDPRIKLRNHLLGELEIPEAHADAILRTLASVRFAADPQSPADPDHKVLGALEASFDHKRLTALAGQTVPEGNLSERHSASGRKSFAARG